MADKVQLIKEEIEKRFNDNMKTSEQYTENSKSRALFTSAAKEDYDLLAFIDSLPEEHNEDLEEEIKNYFSDWLIDLDESKTFCQIARHFAEWGRNHIEDKSEMVSEDLEEEIESFWNSHDGSMNKFEYQRIVDCAHHFAEWQKQQMMKDAVEGRVQCGYGDGNKLSIKAMLPQNSDLKYADKVKVLILKTE